MAISDELRQVKQTKRRNAQNRDIKVVEIKRMHKVKKVSKKVLTKGGESGRIVKLSQRTADIKLKRVEKNLKNFQKPIDKRKRL